MRDYSPKPQIEHHYHIQELIDSQEKRTQDKNIYTSREKLKNDRTSTLMDSKPVSITDYFCTRCKLSFKAQAVRQIEQDWTNSEQQIAFYRTKCFNGHWCIRLITDKHKDTFYFRSPLIALDRGNHHNDIIQEWETGYSLLYSRKNT